MLTCFFIYYLVIAHYSDITGLMLTKLKERLHLWICGQTDIEGNTLNFLRPEVLLQWFTCSFCSVLHPSLFPQLVHVLNMMSAKILTYAVSDDETVADLQLRLEKDTNIPAADQELLLEAGLALEPQGPATQCAIDYTVISKHQYCTHTIPSQNSQQSNVIMDWVTVLLLSPSVGDWWATHRPASGLPVLSFLLQLWTSVCSSHSSRKHPLRPWVHNNKQTTFKNVFSCSSLQSFSVFKLLIFLPLSVSLPWWLKRSDKFSAQTMMSFCGSTRTYVLLGVHTAEIPWKFCFGVLLN